MSDIFISYRRDGGDDLAYRLYESLTAKGYDVFLDDESMRSGDYLETLENAIENREFFLVILSPGALDRCWNEDDVFSMELKWAHKYHKEIVPILKQNFCFPEQLPPFLEDMNFLRIDREVFYSALHDACVEKLISKKLGHKNPPPHDSGFQTFVPAEAGMDKTLEEMGRIAQADITRDIMKFQQIISRAVQGDTGAQMDLADRYITGNGLSKDTKKSMEWLLKAVDQNNARAMYYLGKRYEQGRGIEKNLARAAYWFERSATQDPTYSYAVFDTADCYEKEIGVSRDPLKMAYWYQRAMDLERPDVQKLKNLRCTERYITFLEGLPEYDRNMLSAAGYTMENVSDDRKALVAARRERERQETLARIKKKEQEAAAQREIKRQAEEARRKREQQEAEAERKKKEQEEKKEGLRWIGRIGGYILAILLISGCILGMLKVEIAEIPFFVYAVIFIGALVLTMVLTGYMLITSEEADAESGADTEDARIRRELVIVLIFMAILLILAGITALGYYIGTRLTILKVIGTILKVIGITVIVLLVYWLSSRKTFS